MIHTIQRIRDIHVTETRLKELERDMFHLWEFIWQEGLGDEAREFVDDHKNEACVLERYLA